MLGIVDVDVIGVLLRMILRSGPSLLPSSPTRSRPVQVISSFEGVCGTSLVGGAIRLSGGYVVPPLAKVLSRMIYIFSVVSLNSSYQRKPDIMLWCPSGIPFQRTLPIPYP